MIYVATAVIAGLAVFIGFVVVMAPRHWEVYHENIKLTEQLRQRTEERDHYKSLVRPNEWGTVAQHEAGIKPKKDKVWVDVEQGDIHFQFDDIKDGGER